MCIKIIGNTEKEFNQFEPLEYQIQGAKEVVVSYSPLETQKIETFIEQITKMVKNGTEFTANIKMSANDYLYGAQLERKIRKIQKEFYMNEFIKKLSKNQFELNKRFIEMADICLGKQDE